MTKIRFEATKCPFCGKHQARRLWGRSFIDAEITECEACGKEYSTIFNLAEEETTMASMREA